MLPLDLFIVRHGESEGNRALRRFKKNSRGTLPPKFLNRHSAHFRLTDKGKKQCPVVGKWLKDWLKEKELAHFDRHFVSTHVRALETAALLDLPGAEWEPDFQVHERDNGLWGVIPDKKWQKRYERLFRLGQNHHFYTPMPDGESIANVCDRLPNFIGALNSNNEGTNKKRVIIVSHGDVMRALRVIFEGISPDHYHELIQENQCDFKFGNGQIIHYTRVDPISPAEPKSTNYDRFGWVRSINPWCPEFAGHDWKEIKRPRCSNAELLEMVERFPRLLKG